MHLSNSGLEGNAFNPPRLTLASVEFRVEGVEVFAVEFILDDAESFSETLEMYDFTLTQESDGGGNLWILYGS